MSWFVLKSDRLECYSHPWSKTPQRSIRLNTIQHLDSRPLRFDYQDLENSFYFVQDKKELTLIAISQTEMNEWIDAIKTQQYQYSIIFAGSNSKHLEEGANINFDHSNKDDDDNDDDDEIDDEYDEIGDEDIHENDLYDLMASVPNLDDLISKLASARLTLTQHSQSSRSVNEMFEDASETTLDTNSSQDLRSTSFTDKSWVEVDVTVTDRTCRSDSSDESGLPESRDRAVSLDIKKTPTLIHTPIPPQHSSSDDSEEQVDLLNNTFKNLRRISPQKARPPEIRSPNNTGSISDRSHNKPFPRSSSTGTDVNSDPHQEILSSSSSASDISKKFGGTGPAGGLAPTTLPSSASASLLTTIPPASPIFKSTTTTTTLSTTAALATAPKGIFRKSEGKPKKRVQMQQDPCPDPDPDPESTGTQPQTQTQTPHQSQPRESPSSGNPSSQNPLKTSGRSMSSSQINNTNKQPEKAKKVEIKCSVDGTLDMSRQELTIVPQDVFKFKRLTVLNLYLNQLKILPPEIGRLSNLRQLGLNENLLKYLPKEIGKLKNLEILDCRSNRLKQLPTEIKRLANLKKLFLRTNKLSFLPPEISFLKSLELLSIRNNLLLSLPPTIGCLTCLRVLDAHQNQLKEIPPGIGLLQELIELNLQCNQITTIPSDVRNLSKLLRLHLGFNKFVSFPKEIGCLKDLQELDVEGNMIKQLEEDSIGNLESLTRLYFNSNKLEMLPENFGRLTSLRELFLNGNKLSQLPSSFQQLPHLKEIDISSNSFSVFPNFKLFKYATILKLQDNMINSIPDNLEGIEEMTNLKHLNLGENRINRIPPSFCRLGTLTELRLVCNELTNLPRTISQLTSLKTLLLDQNQLIEIVPEIGSLPSLSLLSLMDNRLDDLPDEIIKVRTLSQLKLDGNPLKNISVPVIGGAAVFQFILKRVQQKVKKMNVNVGEVTPRRSSTRSLMEIDPLEGKSYNP
eukprot:TRINITY_DN5591_c0_g1_i1.p1 TRINITY_DN5591_c0_g1~~TRINITY_DN5591_c0_g1_i1.p1  ORF type:complete len:965 (-),score=207.67 TRINITY_DN5591_c0_g1_i1:167-3061(-)